MIVPSTALAQAAPVSKVWMPPTLTLVGKLKILVQQGSITQ